LWKLTPSKSGNGGRSPCPPNYASGTTWRLRIPLTLIDLDGAFFVTPKLSLVPKLAAEIERLRQEAGLSVEDLLEGLDEQRRRYYREKKCTSA